MRNLRVALSVCRTIACLVLGGTSTAFAEPPDLELNPATGFVESVDIADDGLHQVRHVIDRGPNGGRTVSLISTDAGQAPRLAIKTGGDSWVVWTRDAAIDQIRYAVRSQASGAWSPEAVVSDLSENSHNPEIAHHGTSAWIVYEVTGTSATSIGIVHISDDPDPIPCRTTIASTPFTGDVDVLVHSESGHLWVTWVDSATYVGWSEYDSASSTWDPAHYRSYATTTVGTIRKSIRDTVLGL